MRHEECQRQSASCALNRLRGVVGGVEQLSTARLRRPSATSSALHFSQLPCPSTASSALHFFQPPCPSTASSALHFSQPPPCGRKGGDGRAERDFVRHKTPPLRCVNTAALPKDTAFALCFNCLASFPRQCLPTVSSDSVFSCLCFNCLCFNCRLLQDNALPCGPSPGTTSRPARS